MQVITLCKHKKCISQSVLPLPCVQLSLLPSRRQWRRCLSDAKQLGRQGQEQVGGQEEVKGAKSHSLSIKSKEKQQQKP